MQVGDKIVFDKCNWRVLDIQNGNALLLCDKILEEKRPYHTDYVDITWEKCTLRQYLNNEFLNIFSHADRSRIVKSSISNAKNPWFGTDDSMDTSDYVFLLSLEEVVQYFGDIGQLTDKSPNSLWNSAWKDDPYRTKRGAKNASGVPSWWWLRSPGIHNKNAAYINGTGRVFVGGDAIRRNGGVRPALWLKLT